MFFVDYPGLLTMINSTTYSRKRVLCSKYLIHTTIRNQLLFEILFGLEFLNNSMSSSFMTI